MVSNGRAFCLNYKRIGGLAEPQSSAIMDQRFLSIVMRNETAIATLKDLSGSPKDAFAAIAFRFLHVSPASCTQTQPVFGTRIAPTDRERLIQSRGTLLGIAHAI